MRKINTDLPEYIYQSSITALIDKIDEEKVDSEIPWNTFGGSVYAGQRFIDYLNSERDFKINANVSGIVASMGPVTLPFFDHVKGAEQSDLMIHSVAGGSNQEHTNKFLYDALAKKIDEVKFKEVTGLELKKVMLAKEDERINVWITGKQAKYIGFYDETYDLLDKAASLDGKLQVAELNYELPENIAKKYGLIKENNLKPIITKNDMEIKDVTASILQKENTAVYNAILDAGKKAEQERTASIMKYAKYDMDKANEILKNGESLTTEHVEHFMDKKHAALKLAGLEDNSEKELDPAKKTVVVKKAEATPEQKEKAAALEELDDKTGVNDKIEKK